MNPTILEGFAGPGGFSEAARMIGLTNHLGIELNTDACAAAQAAGHARLQADIRTMNPGDFPTVTGWISAPPCPTYSASGKLSGLVDYQVVLDGLATLADNTAGMAASDAHTATYGRVSDERTALVLETLKFAFRLPNVQWIVAEQVPAVHDIWAEMCAELAAAADWESCNVVKLRADDYGAATTRERVFLVATRGHTPDFTGMPMRGWWSCGRFQPPRINYVSTRSPFPLVSMARALDWPAGVRINTRGVYGKEFSADAPAHGLTHSARTWYRTDLGSEAGRLTSAQAGLLQGFPTNYPWAGSRTSQFQRVADTVSPLVGAAVLGTATGRPWQDAVRARIRDLYGDVPMTRPETAEQLDLLEGVAA